MRDEAALPNGRGKIYALLTQRIAGKIYANVPGLREVYIWLCSQIGQPIDRPLIGSAQVVLQRGVVLADVQSAIESVIADELAKISDFTGRLAQGEWTVW
jgi:S-adenosylmethionine synthetase